VSETSPQAGRGGRPRPVFFDRPLTNADGAKPADGRCSWAGMLRGSACATCVPPFGKELAQRERHGPASRRGPDAKSLGPRLWFRYLFPTVECSSITPSGFRTRISANPGAKDVPRTTRSRATRGKRTGRVGMDAPPRPVHR
jgi:hypothetical protein